MSGRSAYVRKEKTKIKETIASDSVSGKSKSSTARSQTTLPDFPMPGENIYGASSRKPATGSVTSGGSGDKRLDDSAYARVRKPAVPVIDVSGIEKSSFRSMMDKRSEGIRKGLSVFGKKKKTVEDMHPRPETSATIRPESHELEGSTPTFAPEPSRPKTYGENRPGPPSGKLPALPAVPQLKRYTGSGRSPQPWNKLRKDPELWDPHGDTLIFLAHETHEAARPPPSFRVSSHVLERTESRFFSTILREGCTEFNHSSGDETISTIPTGMSASGMRSRRRKPMGNQRMGFPNPPSISENGDDDPNGQISYELYFPAPINQSKIDSLRFHVTTRNVFAILYRASLVGISLFQALEDLLERLQQYMPTQTDCPGMIIDYITLKGIDDARNDPTNALSLLLWSELRNVRWVEGWREFFVHCAGMHDRLESVQEIRLISPITKALLERASLESEVRVQNIEDRLVDFNFNDMWPAMSPTPPPERISFDRLRDFIKDYYTQSCGHWPVLPPPDSEQWLTRDMVTRLQKDFGALYDYLVNRDVVWESSEERPSRKWTIINSNNEIAMSADTPQLPMTDILVAFDNRHRYPHIPHPYPLVPESIPAKQGSDPSKTKKSGKTPPPPDDKITERRMALAYVEATNIYLLGPEFAHNALVSAFVRFEKTDQIGLVDPLAARRGRWVLLYGILQALASVSVDTPGIRYSDGVSYHLNPQLRGTPPWRKTAEDPSASHMGSHCWTVPATWNASPAEADVPLLDNLSVTTSPMMSPSRHLALMQGRERGGSVRSSAAPSTVGTESDTGSVVGGSRANSRRYRDVNGNGNANGNGTNGLNGDNKAAAWNYRRGLRSAGGENERIAADRLTLGSSIVAGQGMGVPSFSPNSGFSTVVREQMALERERERVRESQHGGGGGVSGVSTPVVGAGVMGMSYGPGIAKVEEWPIREESMHDGGDGGRGEPLIIKDFDDYNF